MPNVANDDPIQSRVAQLEAIAARRNELLGEMYQLMRQRHGLSSSSQESDDEEEGLQAFLDDFELQKSGENGFIEHHVERLLKSARDSPISSKLVFEVKGGSTTASRTPSRSPKPEPVEENALSGEERGEGSEGDQSELDLPERPRGTNAEEGTASPPKASKGEVGREEEDTEMNENLKEEDEGMDLDAGSPEPSELAYPESPVKAQAHKRTPSTTGPHPPQLASSIVPLPTTSNGSQTGGMAETTVVDAPPQPERHALKATPSEPCINPALLTKHHNAIIIPAPLELSLSSDQFTDVAIASLPDHPQTVEQTSNSVLQYKMEYPLPHPSILPPEFNRKKASKRKKDRTDKSKSDDLPMGLNRWAATLNANPIYHRLRRSTKCLTTKDWTVAISELKLIRTIERIEKLKHEGRWAFRQTKKQRGVGGLMKTHWDYLLDEMKWMRTDFREERKWKHAVAYQLSTSVLEWHALGSWDERVEHGVCVKWKPMQEDEGAVERGEGEEVDMDTDLDNLDADGTTEPQDSGRSSRLAVDHASDDEDEDMENDGATDPKDVVNHLSAAEDLEGAMDEEATARELEKAQAEIREADEKHLKKEDTDDGSALRDNDAAVKDGSQGRGAEPEIAGLKSTSKDPMLGSKSSSHSLNGDAEDSKSNSVKARISAYAPMREKIVYSSSDKLFIGPDDVEGFVHSENPDSADYDVLHALGLGTLFPELQPFGMLDVAPSVVPEPGAKKRSSRSADKDDPNKRVEETNYTKVMPAGRFMTVKPTLLGPLQPAKNYKDGKWLPMEEYAIAPDVDSTGRITEESLCELFDFKVKTSKGDGLQARNATQRGNDQYWSTNDDLVLKSLIDRYPGNWNLIAECFNGARLTTPSDRKSASDCQDRWRAKWASDLQAKSLQVHDTVPAEEQDDNGNSNVTPSTSLTSMTTRGHKRMASASTSSQQAPSIAAGSEPKKRRRHFLIQETMRRAGKKRQEHTQKMLVNQRKPPAQMHDTHLQLHKLPKLTPAELSRQKAERDAAQMLELQKARAKQDDLARARLTPQAAAALVAAQQQAAQQAQQQQAQQPQQQAQGGQATPSVPLTPAQHQILLQQAAAAQAQANQVNQAVQGGQGQANPANRVGAQGNVGIARISTPSAPPGVGGARLTSQQIMQLQAVQQQRSLSQQMANGAVNGTGVNGNTAGNAANRDPTASPAQHGLNSPHLAGSRPANSPSPVPGVAQAGSQGQQATRSGNHYLNTTQYTPEQLQAVRLQMMIQHQHQQAQRLQQEAAQGASQRE